MIDNDNKEFFIKHKAGLKIFTIALIGMIATSPFWAKGIVNELIHNESTAVQEEKKIKNFHCVRRRI